MASIVDTSVKNFNSTMSGVPAVSGTTGSLIALLDAVLVNGFDTKTASALTVAGGIASMPFTGSHSAQLDSVILIAGITGTYASLNGEQKVTAVGPGVVKFGTAMADGVPAGTITFKMAPAGWEKVFTGTNKAVYRSLDPTSTKMLLRVDDSGTTQARVVGYESMTDIDTGVGAFPAAAQISGGGYWPKSLVATAGAAPWQLYADSKIFYVGVQFGAPNNAGYQGVATRAFGDVIANKPGGDAYSAVLNYSAQSAIQNMTENHVFGGSSSNTASPRSYTGLGSSQLQILLPFVGTTTGTSGADGYFGNFPSQIDGSLQLTQRYVSGGTGPRGTLPGIYYSPQGAEFNTFSALDRVPGAGLLSGRTLQAVNAQLSATVINIASTTSNCGIGFVDITGPWR